MSEKWVFSWTYANCGALVPFYVVTNVSLKLTLVNSWHTQWHCLDYCVVVSMFKCMTFSCVIYVVNRQKTLRSKDWIIKNTDEQYVIRLSISSFILVMNIAFWPLECGSFDQVLSLVDGWETLHGANNLHF